MGKSFTNESEISEKTVKISNTTLTSEYLPLIIKKYVFPDAFSEFIHHSQHQNFEIQGPHVQIIM